MDSYRASKAWHIGQELAKEVHDIVKKLPEREDFNLPGNLRRTSVSVPLHIATSVTKKVQEEKLQCYVDAREAAIELQKHLAIARSEKYIEDHNFETLLAKAIETQNILTTVIRKAMYDMAAAKE